MNRHFAPLIRLLKEHSLWENITSLNTFGKVSIDGLGLPDSIFQACNLRDPIKSKQLYFMGYTFRRGYVNYACKYIKDNNIEELFLRGINLSLERLCENLFYSSPFCEFCLKDLGITHVTSTKKVVELYVDHMIFRRNYKTNQRNELFKLWKSRLDILSCSFNWGDCLTNREIYLMNYQAEGLYRALLRLSLSDLINLSYIEHEDNDYTTNFI